MFTFSRPEPAPEAPRLRRSTRPPKAEAPPADDKPKGFGVQLKKSAGPAEKAPEKKELQTYDLQKTPGQEKPPPPAAPEGPQLKHVEAKPKPSSEVGRQIFLDPHFRVQFKEDDDAFQGKISLHCPPSIWFTDFYIVHIR